MHSFALGSAFSESWQTLTSGILLHFTSTAFCAVTQGRLSILHRGFSFHSRCTKVSLHVRLFVGRCNPLLIRATRLTLTTCWACRLQRGSNSIKPFSFRQDAISGGEALRLIRALENGLLTNVVSDRSSHAKPHTSEAEVA